MTRKGDWLETFTGRAVYPLDMTPADVTIKDVAHSLALQCRFMGHCRSFYSVAQHSYFVAREVERVLEERNTLALEARNQITLLALLHDASEVYLTDLPRPLKKLPEFAVYREIEQRVQSVVLAALAPAAKLDPQTYELITQVDLRMLATEARDLMAPPPQPWNPMPAPYDWHLGSPQEPLWDPQKSEIGFLAAYSALVQPVSP